MYLTDEQADALMRGMAGALGGCTAQQVPTRCAVLLLGSTTRFAAVKTCSCLLLPP